ncbi:MAG: tRNA epoxyqueuosine(34) reductase QueG [Gemmatimonadetes bacterium]|nr:tRNA epoxyqueuosine(34) reductase QueG [Gemmatimonadota bacterium]MBT4611746.1 tRNA epoxyqueuosine(34) reductase QueG [Gemmatimonadota bacterium]MBT5055954.1 tRNA epoxyqueuosine(34) reductase QueG [Gemmatimonadota bacterium]MBT5143284.1 tRNA epoxyqueuosine(34) reductase QueG [Gemmatimonadota bacterium]MBT5586782.1 tRNA epoxyqueuosine(34) reductase QueG [Gemmatimonadota bacterium]
MPAAKISIDRLRQRALQLGFSLFGVAPAAPLEAADFYARWIALGYAGQMGYLERAMDRRREPQRLLAGAHSVICLGMHYPMLAASQTHGHTPTESDSSCIDDPLPASDQPLTGRMAGYALGDDYHDIVQSRARQLLETLQQEHPAAKGRCFVDTAPVLERELGQLAGLGWWGKNTCLINKQRGSAFFLAEIVTTAQLPFDEPAVDHCGTCTRCLDACPTDAFPEAYTLDARRCISYLTIELRGPIPRSLRSSMGAWIFGCDICQDVCPWNRRAPSPIVEDLHRRLELATPDLLELLQLDEEGFRHHFRKHPVKRTKRSGLLRNVAVAIGNVGDERAVPILTQVLAREPDPLVRGHVAWALGHIGGAMAMAKLQAARATEVDTDVLQEIDAAIKGV